MDPLAYASLLWQNYHCQQLLSAIVAQSYLNFAALNTFVPPTPSSSPSPVIAELPPDSPRATPGTPESLPSSSSTATRSCTPHSQASSSSPPLLTRSFCSVPSRLQPQISTVTKPKTSSAPSNHRPSKRLEKTLWVFILRHLEDESKRHLVEWTNEKSGEFRFVDPEAFARLWGEHKGERERPMRFEVMTRGLRFYYKKGIVEKIKQQKHLFRFLNVDDLKEKLKQI